LLRPLQLNPLLRPKLLAPHPSPRPVVGPSTTRLWLPGS
jgi:hypothetical protein